MKPEGENGQFNSVKRLGTAVRSALIVLALLLLLAGLLYGVWFMRQGGVIVLFDTEGNEAASGPEEEPVPTPMPSPVPTPTPAPVPTPLPPEAEEVLSKYRELLDAYTAPMEEELSESLTLPDRNGYHIFQTVLARREPLCETLETWRTDLERTATEVNDRLSDYFGDYSLTYDCSFTLPDWKTLGSLLCCFPGTSPELFFEKQTGIEMNGEGVYCLSYRVSVRDYRTLLTEYAPENETYLTGQNLLAYLTTVYDDEGKTKAYAMPETSPGYLEGLTKPLKKCAFRDAWYQGRSHNTRKHTGLDMRASGNAPIYSCTDGTVTSVGYNPTAGNYVLVMDDLGYEYHYYHMIRLTTNLKAGQRVSAGDEVGRVGNTGNSEVNHLHLTLITPDYEFVKLYGTMKTLYKRK